ncbi:hypothetical protein E2562_001472 [Oryza meyeriana var. granulata]|uniref:Reverse transcriptase zinc-binding domain-containing protein n=1 Tax=Oryza meyeriana var. granulata TaxID=110450 RepID=A0A6G1DCY3_9ORYZ|nr:hypothetical protein E2562_001472 [Oryza meyeriana var. granulata]
MANLCSIPPPACDALDLLEALSRRPLFLCFGIWHVLRSCLTADNLAKRNWPCSSTIRLLCASEAETCSHMFFSCSFTRQVWDLVRPKLKISPPLAPKSSRPKLDAALILISWLVWKEHNARVFQGASRPAAEFGRRPSAGPARVTRATKIKLSLLQPHELKIGCVREREHAEFLFPVNAGVEAAAHLCVLPQSPTRCAACQPSRRSPTRCTAHCLEESSPAALPPKTPSRTRSTEQTNVLRRDAFQERCSCRDIIEEHHPCELLQCLASEFDKENWDDVVLQSSSMEPWCELHLLLAGATSGLSREAQEGCDGARDGRACGGVQVRTAAVA